MKLKRRLLCVLIVVSACQQKEKVIKTYYENGELKEADSTRNGTYKGYYENGQLAESSIYVNNTLKGERRIYYDNGNLQGIENYVDGHLEGKFKYFFENGNVETSGIFRNGKVTGKAFNFFEFDSGKVYIEADFLAVKGKSIRTNYIQYNELGDTLRVSPYIQIEMPDSIPINKNLVAKISLINPEYEFTHFVIIDFNSENLDEITIKLNDPKAAKHELFFNVDTSKKGDFYLRGIAIHHSVKESKGDLLTTDGDFNIYFERRYRIY